MKTINMFNVPVALAFTAVAAASPLENMAPGLPPPKDRASANVENFVPRWDGNDIVSGSKRLSVRADSGLTLTEGGKTLFTMTYGCRAESSTTGKTYWPRPCYRFLEGGGKMYREGMNNEYAMKQYVRGDKAGQWCKSKEVKRKGVDSLRKEWKEAREVWASLPDKTEEEKAAKAEAYKDVTNAWHLYYNAKADLVDRLMAYEYDTESNSR